MGKIMTRMGSGLPVEMSENQLMEDLTGGEQKMPPTTSRYPRFPKKN